MMSVIESALGKKWRALMRNIDLNKLNALERINYMSAKVGLMCLRDYKDWKGIACPCKECRW